MASEQIVTSAPKLGVGIGFTIKLTVSFLEQPLLSVTATIYSPAVLVWIVCVVAPLLQA